MHTLINQARFIKATEYISQHYFAKPYSISPMVGRWFNQLAMIEVQKADGSLKVIHLSGDTAKKYVDIILDGEVQSKENIDLIFKFHSLTSDPTKDRTTLVDEIASIQRDIESHKEQEQPEKQENLKQLQEKLKQFDQDKIKAEQLYNAIVERGSSRFNQTRFEADKGKIKHIAYRPNHGLTHSARVAYSITAINAFNQAHQPKMDLTEQQLEQLQMMMLFSVVGRKDETGFSDTGPNQLGRATYEGFRITSGREYLKYSREHLDALYHHEIDSLYRDALIVELMGFQDLSEFKTTGRTPELLIDYVIEKEAQIGNTISKPDALKLIEKNRYSIEKLFSTQELKKAANNKLAMMNQAHAIDLTRCYPLFAEKENQAKSSGILFNYFLHSGLGESLEGEKLDSAFMILRNSFDHLAATGQNTTFGLISSDNYLAKKESILANLQAIQDRFKKPNDELYKEAQENTDKIKRYWKIGNTKDDLLDGYCKYLLSQEFVQQLTQAEKLHPNSNMFAFQQCIADDPNQLDHHQTAVQLVRTLEAVKPAPGVTTISRLPIISEVQHDREHQQVTLFFDDTEQAVLFKQTYRDYFNEELTINEEQGRFTTKAKRNFYLQLRNDRLIEFKLATVPEVISREETLIGENGKVSALNVINRNLGLGRLVSTTVLHPGERINYEYYFNELAEPATNRFKQKPKQIEDIPLKRTEYRDPRTGKIYQRQVIETQTPLRFQEPILTPVPFSDKIADGLTVGTRREANNTIFTPTRAYSHIPQHGRMSSFNGYQNLQYNYFPIGILSNLTKADLKDERYVWSENMTSVAQDWIRDFHSYEQKIFQLLFAKTNQPNNTVDPKRPLFDKERFHTERVEDSLPATLVEYCIKKTEKIVKKLDEKHYRPTKERLHQFRALVHQEQQVMLAHVKGASELEQKLKENYQSLLQRIKQEEQRKHPKYSITLKQLIVQEQQKKPEELTHSEILARGTKAAVEGLYASTNTLLARLNLAYNALQIKTTYHYDVPLLVLSPDKEPYLYTEELIKADLHEAYKLIRANQFPFDRTMYPVLEQNNDGKVITLKDANGQDLKQPKNLEYQQQLLVKLFQLGIPRITDYHQLSEESPQDALSDEERINQAIDTILTQMDVIGNLRRETARLDTILTANSDQQTKEAFFLRAAALGHTPLLTRLLDNNERFTISTALLHKAIQFAQQNNHTKTQQYLESKIPLLTELKNHLEQITLKSKNHKSIEANINSLLGLEKQVDTVIAQYDCPEIKMLWQQKLTENCLNLDSISESNQKFLPRLLLLLRNHPELISSYAKMVTSNKAFQLGQLLEAHEHLLDVKAIPHALHLAETGWEAAHDYLQSLEQLKKQLEQIANGNSTEANIKTLLRLEEGVQSTQCQEHCPELFVLWQQKRKANFLNSASAAAPKNQELLPELMELLRMNPDFIRPYSEIMAKNEAFQLQQLLDTYNHFGYEATLHAMGITNTSSWAAAHHYLESLQTLEKRLDSISPEDKTSPNIEENIRNLLNLEKEGNILLRRFPSIKIETLWQHKKVMTLLNPNTIQPDNKRLLPDLLTLFSHDLELIAPYAKMVASNKPFRLDQLLQVAKKLGSEVAIDMMQQTATLSSWEVAYKDTLERVELQEQLQRITLKKKTSQTLEPNIKGLLKLEKKVQATLAHHYSNEINTLWQQKLTEFCLNPDSINESNQNFLPQLLRLLRRHPELISSYAKMVASNKAFQLDQLIESYQRLGIEAISHALHRLTESDWESTNHYLQTVSQLKKQLEQITKGTDIAANINQLFRIEEEINSTCHQGHWPDLRAVWQDEMIKNFLNEASATDLKNRQSLPQLMTLLRQNPTLIGPYSEVMASNKALKIDQLLDAHQRLGCEATRHALQLTTKTDWETANNYLVLKEIRPYLSNPTEGDTSIINNPADFYLDNNGQIDAATMTQQIQRCETLINAIKAMQISHDDDEVLGFCRGMDDALEVIREKQDFTMLNYLLPQLIQAHDAVCSKEMKEIKEQITRLENKKNSFFSFGNKAIQTKVAAIKDALCQIPIADRLHAFSGTGPKHDALRLALASHRHGWHQNPTTNNQIDEKNAATSYTELKNKFLGL